MKKLIYVFVVLILVGSLYPTANYSTPSGDLEFVLESQDASEFDLVQSRAVMLNRLETYGIEGAEITVLPDRRQLLVKLPDEAAHEPILPLLVAPGALRFSETYTRAEMVNMLQDSPYRQEWRRWLTVDADNLGRQAESAVLAELDREEISAFLQFVEGPDYMQGLPPYLNFTFSRRANADDQLSLYALQNNQRDRIVLSSESIEEARAETNEATGLTSISLSFYPEEVDKWAQVTRKNIGRAIAVVIDGAVYFAPRVMAEIKEGKVQITGQFTAQEARTLAAILEGGELPAMFTLLGE